MPVCKAQCLVVSHGCKVFSLNTTLRVLLYEVLFSNANFFAEMRHIEKRDFIQSVEANLAVAQQVTYSIRHVSCHFTSGGYFTLFQGNDTILPIRWLAWLYCTG